MKEDPCFGCGVCCRLFSLPPFDANEHVRASDELIREVDAYAGSPQYRESDPCMWQDRETGRCLHYDVRPTLCRWFQPGTRGCNELRERAGLKEL